MFESPYTGHDFVQFGKTKSVLNKRAQELALLFNPPSVLSLEIEAYIQAKKEGSSGGDYYRVARSKLDSVFVRALCESVNSGRTSFTEAYRLTNTTSKTFSEVASGLGCVLW